jgi:hypothetical protein
MHHICRTQVQFQLLGVPAFFLFGAKLDQNAKDKIL